MNKRTLKRAIGVSDGKSLTIANDCAEVMIHIERGETAPGNARETVAYYVDGDADAKRFDDLSKALAYAVAQLALYMDGSPNR